MSKINRDEKSRQRERVTENGKRESKRKKKR